MNKRNTLVDEGHGHYIFVEIRVRKIVHIQVIGMAKYTNEMGLIEVKCHYNLYSAPEICI